MLLKKTCVHEAGHNCGRADLSVPKCRRILATRWIRWEGGERARAGGKRSTRSSWSSSSPCSFSKLKEPVHYRCWLLERFSYWLVCHERLSVSHILIFSWLFHPVRHLSSISGHICPQITEHRIPLNLKKFVDSGTALVGRWAGTERGREHTQIPRYSHPD